MKKALEQKGPSAASLREIPEQRFTRATSRPNPYAARIAKEGYTIHVTPGRPRKGAPKADTVPRSIRFPAPVWRDLERVATASGLTVHAAMREAIIAWMKRQPATRTVR
jgi:hypothetical protein